MVTPTDWNRFEKWLRKNQAKYPQAMAYQNAKDDKKNPDRKILMEEKLSSYQAVFYEWKAMGMPAPPIDSEPDIKPRTSAEEILFQQKRMADALERNDDKPYVDRVRTTRCRHVQDAFKLMHRAWWRYCHLTYKVDKAVFPAERCDAAHLPGCDWRNPNQNGLEHGILASPNVHEFLDHKILIPVLRLVHGHPIYHFQVVSDYPMDGYARRYHNQWISLPAFPEGYVSRFPESSE
jgi:hypothetical protein